VFDTILIANRGEIAVRIIRTCRRMGIRTVAVYSDADRRSPYVRMADEARCIGGAKAHASYLDQRKILDAALESRAQAIHPGYGFLSENAAFARSTAEAGLVFVGPPARAIAVLGDKIASKLHAIRAGVPVVPGHHEPLADLDEALAVAQHVGYPILLKPAAGGGGRGMRIVRSPDELPGMLAACREETRKAFADDRIFVERYVERPRHVEIQVLADAHGNVVHLGERECSIQRRHQKVIEETPSPAIDAHVRAEMGRVSCALAREVGYTNAGTLEFILNEDHDFYFLEMNTRLQVEHPVTELVTGLDLVELQLRIASGERLPFSQDEVTPQGWAIEARICAEDPRRAFMPTTGMVTRYAEPRDAHVRVDSGIETGSVITIHYDSLLAKVSAWGATRTEAQQRLGRALNGCHIEGLTTNVDFVNAIVNHPAFIQGELSTEFIDEHFEHGVSRTPPPRTSLHHAVSAVVLVYHNRNRLVTESLRPMSPHVGSMPGVPRSSEYVVRSGEDVLHVTLDGAPGSSRWSVRVDGTAYEIVTPEFEFYRRRLKLRIDGVSHMFRLQYEGSHLRAHFRGIVGIYEVYTPREWELNQHMVRQRPTVEEHVLRCPMPGLVTAIYVGEGEDVQAGQELVRVESMKMESGISSPRAARVERILVQPGSAVQTDEILLTFASP
jgi:propionyl-CoA carboxylase alpha chain